MNNHWQNSVPIQVRNVQFPVDVFAMRADSLKTDKQLMRNYLTEHSLVNEPDDFYFGIPISLRVRSNNIHCFAQRLTSRYHCWHCACRTASYLS